MRTSARLTVAFLLVMTAVMSGCSNDKGPSSTELEAELKAIPAPTGVSETKSEKSDDPCSEAIKKYSYTGSDAELFQHYSGIAAGQGWASVGTIGDVDASKGATFLKELGGAPSTLNIKRLSPSEFQVTTKGPC